jgi:hypothetical protein
MADRPKDTVDALRYPTAWGGHVSDRPEPDLEDIKMDLLHERCPKCNLNWRLFSPAQINGLPLVRCVECKSVYAEDGSEWHADYPADAAVETLANELGALWARTAGSINDAMRVIARHVLAARQPKPEDLERIKVVIADARTAWGRSGNDALHFDEYVARAILALYPSPPNHATEIERLTTHVRELEALTVEPTSASDRLAAQPPGTIPFEGRRHCSVCLGVTPRTCDASDCPRNLTTIHLGEGLTEAQEGWSAVAKINGANEAERAADALGSVNWFDTFEGSDTWSHIHGRLADMAAALRASATPRPEAVDWVKRAEEHRRKDGHAAAKAIMAGLREQIAALRAAGGV